MKEWVLFEAYGNKIPLIDEEEEDVVEQLVRGVLSNEDKIHHTS